MALDLITTTAGRAAILGAIAGSSTLVVADAQLSDTDQSVDMSTTALSNVVATLTAEGSVRAAGNGYAMHVILKDDSAAVYDVRALALRLDDGTFLMVYSQGAIIASKATGSSLHLAIDLTIDADTAATITFGDTDYALPASTESAAGAIELATTAETDAGTDAFRAITPYQLSRYIAANLIAGNIVWTGTHAFTHASGVDVSNTLTAGALVADTGGLTTATGITATTGNIAASAGNVTASGSMTAGAGIACTSGNIAANSGNVSASGSVSAGGAGISTTGAVSAGTNVTAGTGITCTTGNIAASAGSVTAGVHLTANTGDIKALAGVIAATGALGDVGAEHAVYAGVVSGGGYRYSSDGLASGETYLTRGLILPIADGVAYNGSSPYSPDNWTFNKSNRSWSHAGGTSADYVEWVINIPIGARVTAVRAECQSSPAPTGMSVELWAETISGHSLSLSQVPDDGTTIEDTAQLQAVITTPELHTPASERLCLRVYAAGSGGPAIQAVHIAFQDFGPGVVV